MDNLESTLVALSDEQLKKELDRRSRVREEAYWEQRKKEAKYFCPDCGMPDSWHTIDCPSDTDCT